MWIYFKDFKFFDVHYDFADKLMLIHKINPSVYYNFWLKHLHTQLNKPTNQNLLKVPKVANPTNKKILL